MEYFYKARKYNMHAEFGKESAEQQSSNPKQGIEKNETELMEEAEQRVQSLSTQFKKLGHEDDFLQRLEEKGIPHTQENLMKIALQTARPRVDDLYKHLLSTPIV